MSRILVSGIATLDIINSVDGFPHEDAEVRASRQQLRCGGNAANTASVLAQLGHDIHFSGTLADDMAGHFIIDALGKHHININNAGIIQGAITPTSYITLNSQNGSRTIVHYRDLAELNFAQFDDIKLDGFNWCHFEGRNCTETLAMMRKVQQRGIYISLEIEKEREHIDELMPIADCIFFSRPFARGRGFNKAEECLLHFAKLYPDKLLTCTWGTEGAWGWSQQLLHSPAFIPARVVDTIGAGDTFNAGIINALLQHHDLQQALTQACKLAGYKCGQHNFDLSGLHND